VQPTAFGVDGCRSGWFFFELAGETFRHGVAVTMAELIRPLAAGTPVFVDMPIGLSDRTLPDRGCDAAARAVLGPRRSSVFTAPARRTLKARTHAESVIINRAETGKGISVQAYNIIARIAELDDLLDQSSRARRMLREAHPEVSFWALAGGTPMAHPKKTAQGFTERLAVLEQNWPQAKRAVAEGWLMNSGNGVSRDDVLDAMANALVAKAGPQRWRCLPDSPQLDAKGRPMEIVYADFDASAAQ
jgi:predicted RNase H-like nuclease